MSVYAASSHEKNQKDVPPVSKPKGNYVGSVLGKFESRQPTIPRVSVKNKPNESLLLQKVSGGLALCGIYLTERLEDQLEKREKLIEEPKITLVTGATDVKYAVKKFSSSRKEDEFLRTTEILGHSAAVSETSSFGVFPCRADNMETKKRDYLSTIRIVNMNIVSYSLKSSEFKLSKDAKEDLRAILTMAPDSDRAQLACEHFYKRFGSHVNKGPLKFGGTYRWKCSTKGFSHKEEEAVEHIQEQAVFLDEGFSSTCAGLSRSVNINQLKHKYSSHLSNSTCASTSIELTIKGGPPEFFDIPSWSRGLKAHENTWELIDRGTNVIAVWDIINVNHRIELGGVAEVLRATWEKRKEMDCKFSELLVQPNAIRLDQNVIVYVQPGVFQPKVKEHLADSEHRSIKPECIIVSKQPRVIQPGHFTDSEQIAIEPDLSEAEDCNNDVFLQPGVIQPEAEEHFAESAIKQDQSGAEGNESTEPLNLVKMIVDLQSLEKFLEKILAEKLLFTQSKMENIIAQGIANLHSLYRGKYEDVLITILNPKFQSSCLTLKDFDSMHKLYSKERLKFEELKKKNSPPHLQAYLISLVIEISPQNNILQILQQVARMMEELNPKIEEYFLVEINKVLQSGSLEQKQNLQSFKQLLNQFSSNQSINPTPLIRSHPPMNQSQMKPPLQRKPPPAKTQHLLMKPTPPKSDSPMNPSQTNPHSQMNPPSTKQRSRMDPPHPTPRSLKNPKPPMNQSQMKPHLQRKPPYAPPSTKQYSPMNSTPTKSDSPMNPSPTYPHLPINPPSPKTSSRTDPPHPTPRSLKNPKPPMNQSQMTPPLQSPAPPLTEQYSPMNSTPTKSDSPMNPKQRSPMNSSLTYPHSPMNLPSPKTRSTKDPPHPKPRSPSKRHLAMDSSPTTLLKKLGIEDLYPMGLQLKDALCVKSEPLELSLNKLKLTDPKHLIKLILHKLMSYDESCRSDLMPQTRNIDDEDEDKDDKDEDRIHPVDILLALFLCSDNFLRQDLFSRLAKCQFSVPFILPDPFTQRLILPLWSMRSIVKNWKTKTSQGIQEYNRPIVSYKMPIISFLRFGERQSHGASKSKMLNRVISESNHDHFFHHDCPGGQSPLLLGKGLVDMTWYLPFAKHNDSFPDVITFLNLHGDAKDYPRQNMFLSRISTMCFILLSKENFEFDEPTIEILRNSPSGVTILNDTNIPAKKLRSVSELLSEMKVINLNNKNAADITTAIQDRIKNFIKTVNIGDFKTIEDCCGKAIEDSDIVVDENNDSHKEGLELANKVMRIISEHKDKKPSAKEIMLPLHGKLWQSWADKDKELFRQVYRGTKSVNEYTAKINNVKKNIRDEQLKHVKSLTPVMKSFVESLLTFGGPTSNRTTRNYFLQSIRLQLNDLSMDSITVFQQHYQTTREELSILQKKANVREGRLAATNNEIKLIKKYRGDMEVLQKDIVNASFGLEHLLRELGQMYEACPVQSSLFQKEISQLPRAAAELLIDGYPLELMDGDTAHVPLKWVTAVLTEVVNLLNDPKVYVLSILGLQSSGKSTMLNTTFGLQFNVGSGRCTRGAFIQLLPLDEKLRKESNFSYILVVDTEGLRTPGLDSILTQKHDNELATFVIGLANTTLINIMGEVPGDIDDILQTSVHAFLRMDRVRYRKSCQFVHQNTGSSINMAMGTDKFGKKLNKFTVDAAREEGCEGEYETFNDVIKFDNLNDVHHFPGLWKGGPPMAPVSTDYSSSAQNLKYHLIKVLADKDKGLSANVTLSSFKRKLEDIWNAVLKENFVFSFKNTLEITAYNSLEAKYAQWDWEFREEMLKWEQHAENLITAADLNKVSEVVKNSTMEMENHVSDLFKKHQSEMKSFFEEDKQSEILVQWRGRFETKLHSFSGEMREHAKSQILKLGEKRAFFSKIDIKKKEFTRLMTESVQELIRNMKQEREELNSNLKRRKLEQSQLKKILDQDLFGNKDLEIYKNRKYITGEQEERIKQEILQHGSMTGECLNNILLGDILSIDHVEAILKRGQCSESELKTKFDVDWKKMVDSLPYHVEDPTRDIADHVENNLLHYVGPVVSSQLLAELRDKCLRERGTDLHLEVVEGAHYKKSSLFPPLDFFGGDPHRMKVQQLTKKILDQAKLDLQAFKKEKSNYNPAFTQKILRTMDEAISHYSQKHKKKFTLTQRYRFDMYLAACGHAIPVFEEIARSFQKRIDPLEYLELEVKEPLFTKFKDQYYQTRGEEAIANNICAHLERPIKSQIEKSLGSKIVGQMKPSKQYFNSKMALKVKILTDLHKKGDFELYKVYISDVKRSIEEWLRCYTIEYCDEEVNGGNTKLQMFAKEEVSRLIHVVKTTCCESSGDISEWLKAFCTDVKLRKELGVLLDVNELMEVGSNSMVTLDIKNIKVQIKNSIKTLEVKLQDSFNFILCEEEMKKWKDEPHVLLKYLVGCTKQCPFCAEQCDLIDPDHSVPHRAMIHSAGCLRGYYCVATQVLVTEFCPSEVASKRGFRNEATNRVYHLYKDYQKVYPNWSIPPDVTAEDSLYWMHFISKFKDDLATWHKSKPPDVPEKWGKIKWPEIEENLNKIYNIIV